MSSYRALVTLFGAFWSNMLRIQVKWLFIFCFLKLGNLEIENQETVPEQKKKHDRQPAKNTKSRELDKLF